jgi:hypothetical protein
MKKTTAVVVLFVSGIFALLFSKNNSSNVIVGIMEDDRQELANWKEGPSKDRDIRPLFEKRGNEWILSTNHPEEIQWTIAFDGKDSGVIKSRPKEQTSASSMEAYIHVPEPQRGQSLIIGKPSDDFSGWLNTVVNRPLVLVSRNNFSDPDLWKPFQPSGNQTKFFRSAFRAEYSKVTNCDEDEKPLPGPWKYEDSAIRITQSYHSKNGDSLVGMFLEGGRCGINEDPFVQQLFLFKPDKSNLHIVLKSRHPESFGNLSLSLVDAGDYDADGKSELIFFLSGYNEDGYALAYDSFRKSVHWTWSYH